MARKLTQIVLADRVEISRRHLQMIEAGKVIASIEIAHKMKKFFRCSWEEILDPKKT
jgi:DNA-binding XRE family transcriptional regulator